MYCMDNQILYVTDIERSAIHDGPGIRTVVFLQGCPLRCFWCCNPETQPAHGVLMQDGKKCVGCGACAKVCPKDVITLNDGRAWVNRALCDNCGKCADVCPMGVYELSCRAMSVSEIMDTVCRDRAYYDATGGGLTLSGGEPLIHQGAVELLKRAKEAGISTWVETTAAVPWNMIEKAARYTDGFYIDYKHCDQEALRRETGADIVQIENNIRRLVETGANVTLRTPVIPGFNDDRDVLKKCLEFSGSLGLKKHVMLPYHGLGRSKYEKLGLEYRIREIPNMLPDSLKDLVSMGDAMGISVQIGG